MKNRFLKPLLLAAASLPVLWASAALADPLACNVAGYKAAAGLTADLAGDVLTVAWDGEPGQQGRLRLAVNGGAPVVQDLSLRPIGGAWTSVVSNASPDFAIVSGVRRISNQQLRPMRDLKIPLTQENIDKYRWEPFWDAPLDLDPKPNPNVGNPPPAAGIPGTDQKGLPRDPSEIKRANAVYAVTGCDVKTDGGRIEVSFPGVTLGVFNGKLVYTVFKGSNLIKQEIVASTREPWVAYKYDAGLSGLPILADSQVAWRDTSNTWQANHLGGGVSPEKVPLMAANRLILAQQGAAGSISAFPPPHKFFWAREVAINMGYNWYRKDNNTTYAFGIRQNEKEDDSENPANWALYSARPGTDQLMTVFLYPALSPAQQAASRSLAFTHNDTYKAIPGYQVMNHHYHMDLGQRWLKEGLSYKIPDLEALKALGFNIVSPIWSFNMFGFDGADPKTVEQDAQQAAVKALPRGANYIELQAAQIAGAKIHSDKDFLIMPNQEVYGGPLGGHTDVLFSKPVLWDQRKPGQPFMENDPKYGKVYHVGDAAEMMEMVKAENVMVTMPHPRSKGSTGFPDAVKDTAYFNDPHYVGFGMRWGMGLDGSERRTCEYRCLPLLDDLSNWMAAKNQPMKYVNSISEVRWQQPGDDIYGSSPVTYVKLDKTPDNPAPVVAALMKGDSYFTTGEVLMSSFAVEQNGKASKVVADLEWTFPLDMVEIVWGDGKSTGRQVISTTDLPAFGSKHFEIPFDATGKKWIRFAAWDSAYNGAASQPQALSAAPAKRR